MASGASVRSLHSCAPASRVIQVLAFSQAVRELYTVAGFSNEPQICVVFRGVIPRTGGYQRHGDGIMCAHEESISMMNAIKPSVLHQVYPCDAGLRPNIHHGSPGVEL